MEDLIKTIPISASSIVIDIGANEGQEIEVLLPTGCEIHSFEPHPMFFKELCKKYETSSNLHLNQYAAWKENGKKTLYFKEEMENFRQDGGASLIKEKTNLNLNLNIEVECIDIAKYIRDLNREIDLLKIDVEGAEYEILNHLFETGTSQKIKNIYFEDHSRKINSSEWHDLKESVLLKYQKNNITLNNWD